MADKKLKLVQQWRAEASERALQIRRCNYSEQIERVRSYMVLITLRRCADMLMREIKKG